LATLVKRLRASRPGALLLDGGDTWQGSATSLWTNGQDMVDATKLLGVDMMAPHWEFTYGAKRVQEITDGRGADYVFVTVGAKQAFDSSYGLLAKSGTVVLVGMPANGVMSEIDPGTMAAYSQNILGSKMGSARIQIDIPNLIALYEQGRLKLDELVTKTYPLEEINEAIAAVKRGDALRNVIVF